jgi:CMP-N-acetylneuraminic acid synthetase
MRILGVIPARGGSKGVPKKNIKELKGKPLIAYTIEAALKSKLDRVIVSTDDATIKEMVNKMGGNTPFSRPEELGSDTAKSIDVAVHALKTMEKIDGVTYDAFMLLQPTTPFRTSQDIDEAIDKLIETGSDSVISVVNVEAYHPARMKFLQEGKLIDPPYCESYENQNRQELNPMYIRNGAIYLTKRDTLLNNSYKGNDCCALIMPSERSINIDTLTDFEYAEWISNKK